MENQEAQKSDTIPAPPPETVRFVGEVSELFTALAKAQAEFVEMDRDSEVKFEDKRGGKRDFKYASLAEVLASVRPALNKHGIVILQPFDGDKVVTILALGAARIEVDTALPAWNNVQDMGSALTYIKRYQLKSLLGVNDGEDDDGNAASGTGKVPEPRPRATPPAVKPADAPKAGELQPDTKRRIADLGKAIGFTLDELGDFSVKHGCGPLKELNQAKADALVKMLEDQAAGGGR
jgi:hypothetical protein